MINLKKSDLLIDPKRWSEHFNGKTNHVVGFAINFNGKKFNNFVVIDQKLNDELLESIIEIFDDMVNEMICNESKKDIKILKE